MISKIHLLTWLARIAWRPAIQMIAIALFSACVFPSDSACAAAPKPPAPAPKTVESHRSAAPSSSHTAATGRNPHLHGFAVSHLPKTVEHDEHLHGVTHDEIHPHVVGHDDLRGHILDRESHLLRGIAYDHWWDRHWYYTGDYTTWYINHTGLGAIEGTVSVKGMLAPGVQVSLRRPSGRFFRRRSSKHITHTNSLGHFTMLGVHPDSYRVRTNIDGVEIHAQVHVDPGTTSRTVLAL